MLVMKVIKRVKHKNGPNAAFGGRIYIVYIHVKSMWTKPYLGDEIRSKIFRGSNYPLLAILVQGQIYICLIPDKPYHVLPASSIIVTPLGSSLACTHREITPVIPFTDRKDRFFSNVKCGCRCIILQKTHTALHNGSELNYELEVPVDMFEFRLGHSIADDTHSSNDQPNLTSPHPIRQKLVSRCCLDMPRCNMESL